jgi:1-acyl-sn-glycerol-3-phosphate acyltransferase
MIRSSVRKTFRNVYWRKPTLLPPPPVIFAASHHGWHDGYILFHVVDALGYRSLDWIQEFDAFPLFAKVGGMPFPANDAGARAATLRRTIRLMTEERRSLMLFAEGILHEPPMLWEFGKSIELIARTVPNVSVVPVAIRYRMSLHERPECHVALGEAVPTGPDLAGRTRLRVSNLLDEISVDALFRPERFEVLAKGTPDVNERWDMRNAPWAKRDKTK